jgi:hypothetical protein
VEPVSSIEPAAARRSHGVTPAGFFSVLGPNMSKGPFMEGWALRDKLPMPHFTRSDHRHTALFKYGSVNGYHSAYTSPQQVFETRHAAWGRNRLLRLDAATRLDLLADEC